MSSYSLYRNVILVVAAILAVPIMVSFFWVLANFLILMPTFMLIEQMGTQYGLPTSIALALPGILFMVAIEKMDTWGTDGDESTTWYSRSKDKEFAMSLMLGSALTQMVLVTLIQNWR